MSPGKKAVLMIFLILLVDQILKIWIKTHMVIGQEIHVFGNWCLIHFIENNGMAFGMEMGGKPGKLILSVFRIIAICGIGWYLSTLIRKKASLGLILAVSAIMAGAIGNIIDSAFYGMIFSESYTQRLFFFSSWQSCRYVLFSDNKYSLATLVSNKTRSNSDFFQACF
jgi:signal peptidase II